MSSTTARNAKANATTDTRSTAPDARRNGGYPKPRGARRSSFLRHRGPNDRPKTGRSVREWPQMATAELNTHRPPEAHLEAYKWKRGQSANPAGRQKGIPNKITIEVRACAAELVDDPIYRRNLAKRLRSGKLAPLIEQMLWHYARGKPVERIEVVTSDTPRSPAEIDARLAEIAALLHITPLPDIDVKALPAKPSEP